MILSCVEEVTQGENDFINVGVWGRVRGCDGTTDGQCQEVGICMFSSLIRIGSKQLRSLNGHGKSMYGHRDRHLCKSDYLEVGTLEGKQKPRTWIIRSALFPPRFNGILNSAITVKSLKLVATTSSGHLVYAMKASYVRADNTSLP